MQLAIGNTIQKLKFKSNAVVINAPSELEKEFKQFGYRTSFQENLKSENTLVFIHERKDFLDFLNHQLMKVKSDGVLWIAYPKGTSKIKTDINRDSMRLTSPEFGITVVTSISINETWSALRFRPTDKVGK